MSECKTCGPKDRSGSLAVNLKWREECVSTPGKEKCCNCFKVPTTAEILGFPYWRCLTISFADEPIRQIILCPKCYEDKKNRFMSKYKDYSGDPRHET